MRTDERDGLSPGFKFNDWEMRGVPLRIEIGPKDVAKGTVVLARRDKPGKEGKSFVPQEGLRGRGHHSRSRKFRRPCSIAPAPFATRIPASPRTTTSSRRPSKPASRWHSGAAAPIAKRKSRNRPRPPCAASLSNSPAAKEPAFSAASQPRKRAFSAAPISR